MKQLRQLLHIPETGILVPLVIAIGIFLCVDRSFLSPNSTAAMLRAVAFIGIIAVGQTWLIVVGEIDLSVGSVAGLSAVVAAWLMKNAGWPMELGLVAGLVTGAVAGLCNGLIAVRLGIPAFIATLGMLYIARGRDILLQFLAGSITLSSLGGILGVAAGVGTAKTISALAGWPTMISTGSILVAFLFSAAVGVFFGFYPARKAARLDPIEALRYE